MTRIHKKQVLSTICILFVTVCAFAQRAEKTGWSVKGYSESTARAYFNSRKSLDVIEGIWQSNDGFKYAIEPDVESNGLRSKERYRVIVLESSYNGWSKSEIKGFITYSSVNGVYSLKYFTKNASGNNLESQNVILFIEKPFLASFNTMGGSQIQLIKLFPKVDGADSSPESGAASSKPWTGSSIVIGDRYLATNYHVVEGARSLVVSGLDEHYSRDYKVDVIAVDKSNDLAIIKVTDIDFKGFGFPSYGFSSSTSDVGTDVFVLGYPLISTMGQEVKLTTGIISAKSGYQGDVSVYQISAPIQPGNSGGPVFDVKGNLIGIVNAKHTGADNVGYAIKLTYLRNLVESCSESITFDFSNRIETLPLTEKVKRISPFVYIVKANVSSHSKDYTVSSQTEEQELAQEYYFAAKLMAEEGKRHLAFEHVKKSVDAYPTKENHYLRSQLAFSLAHDYEMAIESAGFCVENDYNTLQCYHILGGAYYALKKWDESIDIWNRVISLNSGDIAALIYRGHCFREKGDTHSALKDLNTALLNEGKISYNYAPAYNEIGYVYMALNDYASAKSYLLKAIHLDPDNGNYWDSYGELMYKLGDYKECLRYMGSAIVQGRASNADWLQNSFYYRGLANKALGFDADAYDDLHHAVELMNDSAKRALDSLINNNNQKSGRFFNVYRFPSFKKSQTSSLSLKAIESSEESTTLFFDFDGIGKGFCSISPDTYIVEKESQHKLRLIKAEGIPLYPIQKRYQDFVVSFALTFPPVDITCSEIDFIEENTSAGEGYGISGIVLKDSFLYSGDLHNKNWSDVIITKDSSSVKGLVYHKSIDSKPSYKRESCINDLKHKAAGEGCFMVLITNDWNDRDYCIEASLYKSP